MLQAHSAMSKAERDRTCRRLRHVAKPVRMASYPATPGRAREPFRFRICFSRLKPESDDDFVLFIGTDSVTSTPQCIRP
jgi:hypothetical protein